MAVAREVAERYYQSFATGDFETATALHSKDCVTVSPGGAMSNTEHEAFGRAFKAAVPDAHMEIVKALESDSEVFLHGRFKGSHTGDMVTPQGTIPASGNTIDLSYADYFRVEDGKIVEHEVIWDQMEMMGQLGAKPPS